MASGSSQASNRSSAEAAIVRRTTTAAGGDGGVHERFLFLPAFFLVTIGVEGGEAAFPEAPVFLDPGLRLGERLGIQREHVIAADDRAAQQAGAFEHADVLGDGIQRDREVRGDFGDARVGVREPREDGAARGVAQGVENAVELRSIDIHPYG